MHKLFVDSRDIVSGHSSNFQIGLEPNIVVKEQTYAVIDKILIPNSWYTITSANNIFYYIEHEAGFSHYRRGFFEPGNYTYNEVAAMLERTLNYSRFVANPYHVTYNTSTQRIEIDNDWLPDEGITCPTRQSLLAFLSPEYWGVTELRGAFMLVGMLIGSSVFSGVQFNGTPYGSKPLVFNQPPNIYDEVTQLFIRGNLGTDTNICRAGGDIIRRVPVSADKNDLIYEQSTKDTGEVHVAPGTYTSLWFQLVDYEGNEIDLNGGDWSFMVAIWNIRPN